MYLYEGSIKFLSVVSDFDDVIRNLEYRSCDVRPSVG